MRSVLALMGADLDAPDHTTLSRRSHPVRCRPFIGVQTWKSGGGWSVSRGVAARMHPGHGRLTSGHIFMAGTEDGSVVKRLQRTEDGWQLVSDNVVYTPVPWPRDAVVLGQVMWTGRRL